jgi:hypothetical protein
MEPADAIAGCAAVLSGLSSFARAGFPWIAGWRIGMSVWGQAASLAGALTLIVQAPGTVLDTPVIVVCLFSLTDLLLAMFDLARRSVRGAGG